MSKLWFKLLIHLGIMSTFSLSGCSAFNNEQSSEISESPSSSAPISSSKEEYHTHSFNDYWSRDNESHWHESTCEHDGEKLRKDVAKHDYNITETAPTYQNEGVRTYRCKVCSYSYTEQIPALVHQYSNDWSSDETGHYHACLDKGYESVKKDFAKHEYNVTEIPSTYDEEGSCVYVCRVCGYTYEKATSKLTHKFASEWSADERGHYHACIDEGFDDLHTDFDDHTYTIEETPATYDAEGSKKYTCKVCGFSYTETIDKIKHNFSNKFSNDEQYHWHACVDEGFTDLFDEKVEHNYEDNVVNPTFDESGYVVHTCVDCGYSYTEDQNNQLEHHYSEEWSKDNFKHWRKCIDDGFEDLKTDTGLHDYQLVVTDPTFTEFGYTTYTCADCGFSYIQYGSEYKPHNYSENWTFNNTDHWHDCTDEGYETLYDGKNIHSYGKWVMDVAPDGTNDGQMHKECSICGYSTGSVKVPASAGNYMDYLHFSLWTNTSTGEQYYSVDGYNQDAQFIYIPDEINGLPVTWLRSYALAGMNSLQYVYISDSVTTIDNGCFSDCCMLETVVLPSELHYIQNNTFKTCSNLVDINFPETLTSIGNSAFYNCTSLETINIKGSPYINGYAFAYCSSLKNVHFEGTSYLGYNSFESCTSLEEIHLSRNSSFNDSNVFANCTSLKKVYIPSETTSLPINLFEGCSSLEEFVVEEGNSVYSFENGCLYRGNLQSGTAYLVFVSRTLTGEFDVLEGTQAFYDQSALRGCQISSIHFPNSFLYNMNGSYFQDCPNLTSVSFDDDHPSFLYQNGAVYNKDLTSIYAVLPSNSGAFAVKNGITYICDYAFAYCKNITSISLPNTLTTIYSSAFSNCISLKSITIPSSVTRLEPYVFSNCYSLETVTLGSNIQELGYGAFYCCYALTSITIPDSVETISGWCFFDCDALQSFNSNNVTSILDYVFYECDSLQSITLPHVERIDYNAFYCCRNLTSISLNDNFKNLDSNSVFACCNSLSDISSLSHLESIGEDVFQSCNSLTTVNMPNLERIGTNAFSNCSVLTSINLPSIVYIGNYSFSNCPNLTSATIGSDITYVGYDAFYCCYSLETTTYDNATYIGNSTNPYLVLNRVTDNFIASISIAENCEVISACAFNNCSQLQFNEDNGVYYVGSNDNPYMFLIKADSGIMSSSYTVKDGCKAISYNAFYDFSNLTNIVIPDSVTSIGDQAFYYCYNLQSFKTPESLKYIGYYAFYSCRSMTAFYLPSSVIYVGAVAFGDCNSMTSFVFASKVPPYIGSDVFSYTWNRSTFHIYVPASSLEAYTNVPANYWHDYAVQRFQTYSSLDDLVALGVPQLW